MKKILLMLASAFFMFSCSQEEGTSPINENTSNLPVSATADAQLKFAKLLSQAASSSIEVRNFLKKEALVQFDNDYDIFYPLIKDKKVSGNQSFRDILLSYCKEENELSQIEQSLPLLNIMVPDLTLFGTSMPQHGIQVIKKYQYCVEMTKTTHYMKMAKTLVI